MVVFIKLRFSFGDVVKAPHLPPGPWKLPVIGNLHQLNTGLPHRRLRELAQQHGPLMHLQLGETYFTVVSSPELAHEFLKAHDLNFASRPFLPSADIIFYNSRDIGYVAYGDYWKQMRKICALQLLSAKRVKSLRRVREEEIARLVASITEPPAKPAAVNLSQMLISLSNAVTLRAAFGGKMLRKQDEAILPVLQQILKAAGGLGLADIFPSSKFVRLVSGLERKLKTLHETADGILEGIIAEHVARRREEDHQEEDLVDVLLNFVENQGLPFPFTNVEVKAVILDIFLAGSDSSSVTVEWAMSQLMNNPHTMEKAQKEVRQVFDKTGKVDEEGVDELVYLKSVVKETFRLHPAAPLLLPREAQEAVVIHGHLIPAKTRVIINAWAIGQDPHHWDEPEKFNPERFADSSVEFMGLDFQFIPFGAGRRICPGIQYGLAVIDLLLANLLYHFDWKLPDGIEPEGLDMSETFGATVRRKNPLYLIPIPYHRTTA
ncbi:unnamed protein product [Linum tenue]|uniref:Cytochrome P450 n=1 Tax=Linum tenue TaxID=586396 RepID=A0AAV0JJA2_9ROSI|nr:unnamed protein product [Linum tenue]